MILLRGEHCILIRRNLFASPTLSSLKRIYFYESPFSRFLVKISLLTGLISKDSTTSDMELLLMDQLQVLISPNILRAQKAGPFYKQKYFSLYFIKWTSFSSVAINICFVKLCPGLLSSNGQNWKDMRRFTLQTLRFLFFLIL